MSPANEQTTTDGFDTPWQQSPFKHRRFSEFSDGDATATDSLKAFARALSIPFVESLSAFTTSAEFVRRVPIGFARRCAVFGCTLEDGSLATAIGDLRSLELLDVIERYLHRPISPVLAPRNVVISAVNESYQQQSGQAQAPGAGGVHDRDT